MCFIFIRVLVVHDTGHAHRCHVTIRALHVRITTEMKERAASHLPCTEGEHNSTLHEFKVLNKHIVYEGNQRVPLLVSEA